MAPALNFAKYEGLGNDFLVIDAAVMGFEALTPALAQRLCDRHRGVGGDGVLWVDRARLDSEGRAVMLIRNADGSRPEMCGNGVRCVVAWLRDAGHLAGRDAVVIESDAGPRPARVVGAGDGAWLIEVEMGQARVQAQPAAVDGAAVEVVDLGNPHGVLFDAAGEPEGARVRAVEGLAVFPNGVNVEFVTPRAEGGFRVRVHERGVGWTQACGTGACAVVAAAVLRGRAPRGERVPVALDGGLLFIEVNGDSADLRVKMTGPARRAFVGSLVLE